MKINSNNISKYTQEQAKPVYILADTSLTNKENDNINIEKIINKEIPPDKIKLIKNIKLNFEYNEVYFKIKKSFL